jgi:uncharacterized protein YegJ (DUF2314 family)
VPAYDLTTVKLAFEDRGEVEHMWVSEVRFDGATITGTLLNEPNTLRNVHEGDRVSGSLANRLSDWMLTRSGRVWGGATIQAMRLGMDERARREHDEAWGLEFGDPEKVMLPADGDDHPMALNMVASLVDFLEKNPGEVNGTDPADGWTMLQRESLAGNAAIVQVLLERGARTSPRNPDGRTALDLARQLSWSKVEALLSIARA